MSRIHFTSDTHFGHANIIKYSRRPFDNADHMDTMLIDNWNSVVSPDDTVYHLGDFTFGDLGSARRYRQRLNGRIHFIWGNHDRDEVRYSDLWETSQPYLEIRIDGSLIVLLHYSLRTWNKRHRGSYHFFGHSHAALPMLANSPGDHHESDEDLSIDVGVDLPAWNYAPVGFDAIKRTISRRNSQHRR